MSIKAGTKSYPPIIDVGPALQPSLPPPLAENTRVMRDHALAKLSALRAKRRATPELDREQFDNAIALLVAEVKSLSRVIDESEAVQ